MFRDPQTVQVGLLPAAAAAATLLRRVDVVREEGPRGVAVGGASLAVGLRVPLIGQLVGVFEGAVLMSGCRHTEKFVPAAGVKNNPPRVGVTWRSRRRPRREVLVRSGGVRAALTEVLPGGA